MGTPGRIPGLDGIRALAVLVVMASHVWLIHPNLLGSNLYLHFTEGGFLGVNAFFVLSGFLITHRLTLDSGRQNSEVIRRFLVARMMRIMPLLLLFLAVHLAYVLIFGTSADFTLRDEAIGIVSTIFQLSNYAILHSSRILADNVGIWSLSIEGQFYILAPILVLPVVRRLARNPHGVILLMGVLYGASVVNAARVYHQHGWESAYLRTDSRISAILLGVLGCLFWQRQGATRPTVERVLAVLAGVGIVGSFSLARADGDFIWFGGMAVFDMSVLVIILMLARGTFPVRGLLDSSPLRRIGRISYGLYLWQTPVIRLLERHAPGMSGELRLTLGLAVIFGLSTLTWHAFEHPLLESGFTRRLKGTPKATAHRTLASE